MSSSGSTSSGHHHEDGARSSAATPSCEVTGPGSLSATEARAAGALLRLADQSAARTAAPHGNLLLGSSQQQQLPLLLESGRLPFSFHMGPASQQPVYWSSAGGEPRANEPGLWSSFNNATQAGMLPQDSQHAQALHLVTSLRARLLQQQPDQQGQSGDPSRSSGSPPFRPPPPAVPPVVQAPLAALPATSSAHGASSFAHQQQHHHHHHNHHQGDLPSASGPASGPGLLAGVPQPLCPPSFVPGLGPWSPSFYNYPGFAGGPYGQQARLPHLKDDELLPEGNELRRQWGLPAEFDEPEMLEGLDVRTLEDFEREVVICKGIDMWHWRYGGRDVRLYNGLFRPTDTPVAVRELTRRIGNAGRRITSRLFRGLHLTLEPKHPNVAEPYPYIYKDDNEGVFFVLHELGAGDLRDAMEGRVEGFHIDSPEKVKEFVRELGGALVHLQGLTQERPDVVFEKRDIRFFREVNPDNVIVVAEGGRLVVKAVNVLSYMDRRDERDLGYHDPELRCGHGSRCPVRAEVFSYGLIVAELVTGQPVRELRQLAEWGDKERLRATLKEQLEAAVGGWPEGDALVADGGFVTDLVDFIDTALTCPSATRPYLRTLLASSSLLHGRLSIGDAPLTPNKGAMYEAWLLVKDKLEHEYGGKIDNLLHAVTSAGRLKSSHVQSERERIQGFLGHHREKPKRADVNRATRQQSEAFYRLVLAIAMVLQD